MHVTGNKGLLSNIRSGPNSQIITASGRALLVAAQGIVNLPGNKSIYDVFYVPGLCKNLLSIGKLADAGYHTLFGPKDCWVFVRGNLNQVILTGSRTHGNSLYRLNSSLRGTPRTPFSYMEPSANIASTSKPLSNLWHQRMVT